MRQSSNRNTVITIVFVILIVAVVFYINRTRNGTPTTNVAPVATTPAKGTAGVVRPGTTAVTQAPTNQAALGSGKEQPAEETFKGCPPEGDGGDPQLNILKNRIDDARSYQPTTVDTILSWQWPKAIERTSRKNWAAADTRTIDQHEGYPVVVQGYLAGAKEEGEESPNCHSVDDHDYHIWLSAQQGPDRTRSVVVELTPRLRAQHPGWDIAVLRKVVSNNVPVRVSGWTMLDPEHPDQVGQTRGTIWEVHPITHIEVQSGGKWIDLSQWKAQ